MSTYISTRWYRSPEMLLKDKYYSFPADIWAISAVMAELYLLEPLFQGKNNVDQLLRICTLFGNPNEENWADGLKLAEEAHFNFPGSEVESLDSFSRLRERIPEACESGLQLMCDMFLFDPKKRVSAALALDYPYFDITFL